MMCVCVYVCTWCVCVCVCVCVCERERIHEYGEGKNNVCDMRGRALCSPVTWEPDRWGHDLVPSFHMIT